MTQALSGVEAIFFDLDGTLIQVEMRDYIPAYIKGLSALFAPQVPPELFGQVMKACIRSLILEGEQRSSNEKSLLDALERHLCLKETLFREGLERFCSAGLRALEPLVSPSPLARPILQACFDRGLEVVIATNPVFPKAVVEARLEWAGLRDFPYRLVTALENSRFCKPNPGYFADLLEVVGCEARQCLMVGNDTEHDLAARRLGIPTFLLDTWLIDRTAGDFCADYRGGHPELLSLVESLPEKGRKN